MGLRQRFLGDSFRLLGSEAVQFLAQVGAAAGQDGHSQQRVLGERQLD
jgi:hypothetical protein